MIINERDLRHYIGCLIRIFLVVWRASPKYQVWAIGITLLASVVAPVQIWMSKVVIDRAASVLLMPNSDHSIDYQYLLAPVAGVFCVWMVGVTCGALTGHMQSLAAYQAQKEIDLLILKKATTLDIAFFESPSFYDLLHNVRSNIHRVHTIFMESIRACGAVVSLVGMLGLLMSLHPAATPILILTTVPHMVVVAIYAKRESSLLIGLGRADRTAKYQAELLASRDAIKEIRVFGLHVPFLRRYLRYCDVFFEKNKDVRFWGVKANILSGFLSMTGTAAIWTLTIVRVASGAGTVGDIALAFQAAERGRQGLIDLFGRIGSLYERGIYSEMLFNFLDLRRDAVEGGLSEASEVTSAPRSIAKSMKFQCVCFKYPGAADFVLRDISFEIKPGERIAIVGENGAGKTTMIKLLARLYDPTSGKILVDGIDVAEMDIESWRQRFGIIFQDFVHYDFSVRENIGFGQVEYVDDLDRVKRAAKLGGAHEMIEAMPKTYETILGRSLGEGTELSGGQWQKIALSRAFMREGPILILDEPTASLDVATESDIYNKFAQLAAGRTTVIISHRFPTVRLADRIFVLQEGRITEQGSHSELMRLKGHYSRMFELQARHYR